MTFITFGLSSNISSWYSARCIPGEKIIELGLDCNRIPATFGLISQRPASRVLAFPVVVFLEGPVRVLAERIGPFLLARRRVPATYQLHSTGRSKRRNTQLG